MSVEYHQTTCHYIPEDKTLYIYVGFEVFTVVVMKSIIFWDMTPCSPLSSNRRFGGTYRLHLQGRRKVQQTNEQAGGRPTHCSVPAMRRGGLLRGLGKKCRSGTGGRNKASCSGKSGRIVKRNRNLKGKGTHREAIKKSLYLNIGKLILESSARYQKMGDGLLWKCRPRRSGRGNTIAASQGATAFIRLHKGQQRGSCSWQEKSGTNPRRKEVWAPPRSEEEATGGLCAGTAGAPATSGSSPPVRRKRGNWYRLLGMSSLKKGAVWRACRGPDESTEGLLFPLQSVPRALLGNGHATVSRQCFLRGQFPGL
jgi:hypothetical protein